VAERWRNWLILWQTPGVGPVTWGRLMQRFGSPDAVLAAGPEAQRAAGLSEAACQYLRQPDSATLTRSLDWLAAPDHHLLGLGQEGYPPLLAEIPSAPPVLFVTGNPAIVCQPQVAIVGSRNPSPDGVRNAHELARSLAAAGITVTSGLALGIDAAAHEGALAATGGTSVAVGGTGPDYVYPGSHRALAHRLANRGALVTEFVPGTPVRRENFPRRNRIISGLCLGTLVVEAAAQSGALITARLATEQGREVFAVPGSIHNPLARGCHALIRQGAKLVETAQDIVEELGSLAGSLLLSAQSAPNRSPSFSQPALATHPNAECQALLNCLGYHPIAPEALIQCSGLSAAAISSVLLMLELEGYVVPVPGGRYCRTKQPGMATQ
jgi:DNA processing protein